MNILVSKKVLIFKEAAYNSGKYFIKIRIFEYTTLISINNLSRYILELTDFTARILSNKYTKGFLGV